MGNENCSYCYKRDDKSENGAAESTLFDRKRLSFLRSNLDRQKQLRCSLQLSSLNETNVTSIERGDIEENMNNEPCIMNSIESYNKILFRDKMKTQK